MPRAKDPKFLEQLNQLTVPDDGFSESEETGNDEDPACIRLKNGIDIEELKNPESEGVFFEVMPDGKPKSNEQMYFDEKDLFDTSTMADRTNRHWNPERKEADADIFYSDEAFTKMAQSMEDITPEQDRGVVKKILKPGIGPTVPENGLVRVHYNAFLEHSKDPFDSTRLRGQEQRFRLNHGDVIPGLDMSVSTMKKGELSSFIIQPKYAFGNMGCPPRIPGKASIMFELELMNFFENQGSDRFFAMTARERNDVPFDQVLKHIRADKDAAKDMFIRNAFREAIGRYTRCINILEGFHLKDEQQEADQQSLLRILYLNIAQCFLNLSRPARTVTYARKALYINSEDTKALFKLGKALRLLGDFDKARSFLQRAHRHRPTNSEISQELAELEKSVQKFNSVEREQCRRMFSGGGITDALPQRQKPEETEENQEVSKEFKDMVDNNLKSFIEDGDLIEILAGNGSRLATYELAYILGKAEDNGLYYKYDTQKSEIYLTKKPQKQ